MHKCLDNLLFIQNEINKNLENKPNIIAVTKTFKIDQILPLVNSGHQNYGENKVQEALEKWTDIKNDFNHIKLHMIGKLQTNKVKHAVSLFDYIHSIDNLKLAEKISNEELKLNKKLKLFIQINIGDEIQKNGIEIDQLNNFYRICTKDLGLNIIGLMCLPPKNKEVINYFLKMRQLSNNIGVKDLSMGMSQDYMEAAKSGSTFLRIGSKIFGERL
jgi:PLP dependent protein